MRSRILRSCSVNRVRRSSSSGPLRNRSSTRAVTSGSSSDWPAATRRTASTKSVPLTCFRRYPAAPAMIASNSASSSANDVRMRHWMLASCRADLAADLDAVAVGEPHVDARRRSGASAGSAPAPPRPCRPHRRPRCRPIARGVRGHPAARPRGRRPGRLGSTSSSSLHRGKKPFLRIT